MGCLGCLGEIEMVAEGVLANGEDVVGSKCASL